MFAPWLAVFGLLAALGAGCASSGEVEKLQQSNRVQDQRLKALEESTGTALAQQSQALEEASQANRGRALVQAEKIEESQREQGRLAEDLEKVLAQMRGLNRKLDKQWEVFKQTTVEQRREIDAARVQLKGVQQLLKTPVAGLPQKTAADRAYREAHYLLIEGQMDRAAEGFADFGKAHPKDPRVPTALFRRGQAFYLMGKYDHAVIPFFEMVDKHGQHPQAVEAKWMLARSLEETGDLRLARDLYAQLIADNTVHKADATRRVYLINQLSGQKAPPRKPPSGTAPEKP